MKTPGTKIRVTKLQNFNTKVAGFQPGFKFAEFKNEDGRVQLCSKRGSAWYVTSESEYTFNDREQCWIPSWY